MATRRRTFLSALGASLVPVSLPTPLYAQRRDRMPSERKEYRDRVTEFNFFRVNSPEVSAWLPHPRNRMFARRGKFLVHASDRGGEVQAWAMDLKSGELRLETEASALDPASLTLTPDEKTLLYVDGAALYATPVHARKPAKLADLAGHKPGVGVQTTPDGQSALLYSGGRLLRISLRRGTPAVLLAGEELAGPIVHSVQPALAYLSNGALYTTKLDGLKPVALPTEPGRVLDVAWSPAMERDDLRLLYLHADAAGRTVNLREYDMNARRDRLVALTSQYAAFSPNADASVFAGASFSKAQPHVLMLVRSVGRELTLCEHQSPDATKVTPLFTPDSQQIFFASMREGKPAIYSIAVEKLVEATEDNSNRN